MILIEELAQLGCQVEFLDRPMTDDPHDQLLLQIRGAVAEYERSLIAERMRRGRLSKLQAGLLLPWTYPPYGYRVHPDRPRDPSGVIVDEAEAAIVAEMFALYLQADMSIAKLAKTLQQRGIPTPRGQRRWSNPTIRGILRNPTYTGQLYAYRTRYREPQIRRSATHPIGRAHGSATPQPPETWVTVGTVPAIVAQEQFDQVQAKLAQNQSFARRNNTVHSYLLRALVSCGTCQLACTARTTHGRYPYYLCNGKLQAVHSHRDEPCPARFIPAEQLDGLVWRDLCEVLTHPELITTELARARGGAWLPQELQARRENLCKGRASLQQQLDRLTDAYLRAIIPLEEYERRRRDLEQKDRGLAEQEHHLTGEAERQLEVAGLAHSIEAFCQRVEQGLAKATFEQKRQLVLLLIDRVIVTGDQVEIRYVVPTTPASEQTRFCHLRKDYFDHPTLGQDHKPTLSSLSVNHLPKPSETAPDEPRRRGQVAPVGENHPQARHLAHEALQKMRDPLTIGQSSAVNHHSQEQTQRICDDVALAPVDELAAVEAARPTHVRGFHRLAVDDGRRGTRLASGFDAHGPSQGVARALPEPAAHPAAEVVVDGLPGRKALRQVAPLDAGFVKVKQSVNEFSRGVFAEGLPGEEVGDRFPLSAKSGRSRTKAWLWQVL